MVCPPPSLAKINRRQQHARQLPRRKSLQFFSVSCQSQEKGRNGFKSKSIPRVERVCNARAAPTPCCFLLHFRSRVPLRVALPITMTGRGTPSRFLASVLRNGVGRYVCQLQRVTLTVSQHMSNSLGAREYVEEKIVDFARQNPGIVVYVNPKKCSIPTLVAEYLNGNVKEEPLTSKTAEEIADIVQKMANQSGLEIIRIRKPFHTDNPSIQGQWHPFTNKPSVLNVQTIGARLQSLEK